MAQAVKEERTNNQEDIKADERALPILPVRDTVLFPHAVLPLTVGREGSVQLINSLGEDKTIVVVAQREARVDNPQPADLYTVGTLAIVHKVVKMPNQSLFVFAEGLERVRLGEFAQLQPFMRARVDTIPEAVPPKSSEVEALQRNVLTLFQQIVAGSPTLSDELSTVAMNIEEPGRLVDFIASSLPSLSTADKQDTLETTDVRIRLEKINQHLAKELDAGILGAALLYGDGAITPAISVLSALEGLKTAAPALPLQRVGRIGDQLQFVKHELWHSQHAVEEMGFADVRDAPVDQHAGIEQFQRLRDGGLSGNHFGGRGGR